jgi:hypothetical protein
VMRGAGSVEGFAFLSALAGVAAAALKASN